MINYVQFWPACPPQAGQNYLKRMENTFLNFAISV